MSLRPYWQFYKDCFPFIFGFAFVSAVLFGFIIGLGIFTTLAVWVGFKAFSLLKEHQFYFYYNIGITKKKLLKKTFIINAFVAIPVFGIFSLISYFFGHLNLT